MRALMGLMLVVTGSACVDCAPRSMFMSASTAKEVEGSRFRVELDCDGVASRGVVEVSGVHHTTTEHHCFETAGSRCAFCSPRFEAACRGARAGSVGKVRVIEGALPVVDGDYTALDGAMGDGVYLWLGANGSADKVCLVSDGLVGGRAEPTPCLSLPSRAPSTTCRFTVARVPQPAR